MNYTKGMKLKAYRVYREAGGNLERTRGLLPFRISVSTLRRWKHQYEWDAKTETDEYILAEKEPTKGDLHRITKELDLKGSDKDVFKQVKKIESLCFAAIKGNEERLQNYVLRPGDFNSAIRALKVCWDTRDKIVSRNIRPQSDKPEITKKISYIQAVIQQAKGDNDSPQKEGNMLVCGSSENTQQ